MDGSNFVGSLSLDQACASYAAELRTAFSHDRRKTVGSSEIGKCARQIAYGKLGLVPDEDQPSDTGFTVRGNIMEDYWSAPLLRHWAEKAGGQVLYSGQANQISLVGKNVPLSSTPDGLCINMPRDILAYDKTFAFNVPDIGPSRAIVTEIKSIDPRYNQAKLPKVPHIPQTMAQLGLIRLATEWKPDWGFVFYSDASDYFRLKAFPVQYDEKSFKSLVKRADAILKCDDPNKMPPEGKMKGGGDCAECPWARQCLGYKPYVADDDPKAPTKAQVAKVDKLAEKVDKLEADAVKVKSKLAEAEGDLYLELGRIKKNFVKGKFTVSASVKKSQNRTDAKKLVALLKEKGATDAEIEACKSPTKEGTSLSVERAG